MQIEDDKVDGKASAGMGTDETGPIANWELCFEQMEQHIVVVSERVDDVERRLDDIDDKISKNGETGGLNQQ